MVQNAFNEWCRPGAHKTFSSASLQHAALQGVMRALVMGPQKEARIRVAHSGIKRHKCVQHRETYMPAGLSQPRLSLLVLDSGHR